jgi:hypothetical protein
MSDIPETLPPPISEKRGTAVALTCRTLREAYLMAQELEAADIIVILPDKQRLQQEYKAKGYVELQVSAKAYESVSELRSSIEYRHQVLCAAQRLSYSAKLLASLLGILIVPGLLIFTWLQASYKAQGYERMAKEQRLWFLLGVLSWVIVLAFCFIFA